MDVFRVFGIEFGKMVDFTGYFGSWMGKNGGFEWNWGSWKVRKWLGLLGFAELSAEVKLVIWDD